MLLLLNKIYAQNDTLKHRSFEELIGFYSSDTSNLKRRYITRAIIEKSKRERDSTWLYSGYQLMVNLYDDANALKYCDSIILLAHNPDDAYYPATAYFMKGVYYYNKRSFQQALNEYLIARKYATERENPYLLQKINYSIGILKNRIGENEEALKIHRENLLYTRKNYESVDRQDYLFSIFALASTYNDLNMLDSAMHYNRLGINESLRLKDRRRYNHFILNTGVTHFYEGKYVLAMDSLQKGTAYFEKIGNLPNMAVGYFYRGKIHDQMQLRDSATHYFQKVDTIFQQNHDLLPVLRETYEYLINYAESDNSLEQQLVYIKQLIKLDSILYTNQIYLANNIVREYDIPRLLSTKEKVIHSLEQKENHFRNIILIIASCLILMTFLFYYQFRRRKLYKKRFDALYDNKQINMPKADRGPNTQIAQAKDLNIPEEVITQILDGLDHFERNKDFLDSQISIHALAKTLGTNPRYLSKVVNACKNQTFINYVNRLRVNYAVEELKSKPEYAKYTIKAIAKDFGFNTGDSFSNSFQKNTGIKLSYFIRQLPDRNKLQK